MLGIARRTRWAALAGLAVLCVVSAFVVGRVVTNPKAPPPRVVPAPNEVAGDVLVDTTTQCETRGQLVRYNAQFVNNAVGPIRVLGASPTSTLVTTTVTVNEAQPVDDCARSPKPLADRAVPRGGHFTLIVSFSAVPCRAETELPVAVFFEFLNRPGQAESTTFKVFGC